ncbi:uncharacterized protein LOC122301926 [Carya illinoinensis]|uniref:uncharacterized protein LOC122301926 n=1 Tax=Carya illinoinensis TaxID=32201 RepID=UPI001C7294B2|nr:uncharacterized protein LOC122301926 [Carya illinoinensis]
MSADSESISASISNTTNMESSPYHLQNSDSPGAILVSNVLTGENYHTWSRSMIMALKAKNKIGFVNGSIVRPASTDTSSDLWERCNNMVSSWIISSVSREIGASIICAQTAKDMWQEIKNRFTQGNGPRIFQLQKDLSMLTQENMSILMLEPLPEINKVFSLMVQEEKQREISRTSAIDTVAFMSKMQESKSSGQRFVPGNQQYRRARLICTHCGMTNHTVDKCYKVHGYPPGFKSNNYRQKGKSSSANQVTSQLLDTPFESYNNLPFSQEDC